MKVVGLMRVRNEELLIKESLDHLSEFVDEIYIFDDASTDKTVDICKVHPKMKGIIREKKWRMKKGITIEGEQRNRLLQFAKKSNPDWFIYLDADERFDQDFKKDYAKLLEQRDYDAICFELYDFYLTPEDYNIPYNGSIENIRKYCGPEYRNILIMFRSLPRIFFPAGDVREPGPFMKKRILYSTYKVKHYGKAKSVKDWERKVNFYTEFHTSYKDKWETRRGKAIHYGKSDFGTKLITWKELKDNPNIRGKLLYEYNPDNFFPSVKVKMRCALYRILPFSYIYKLYESGIRLFVISAKRRLNSSGFSRCA